MKHKITTKLFTIALFLLSMAIYGQTSFTVGQLVYTVRDENPDAVSVRAKNMSISGVVTIPSTVEHDDVTYAVEQVEEEGFFECEGITEVIMSENMRIIDAFAFGWCAKLEKITLSSTVDSLGYSPFDACDSLKAINVDENNSFFSSQDGILFNRDKSLIIQFPINNPIHNYVIPSTVTEVYESAFYGCIYLETIEIPSSVKELGWWSFGACEKLTTVVLPENLERIGSKSFMNCNHLANLTIPSTVNFIGEAAFQYCFSMSKINTKIQDPRNVGMGLDVFNAIDTAECLLIVPVGAAGIYANTPQWSSFANIVEDEPFIVGDLKYTVVDYDAKTVKVAAKDKEIDGVGGAVEIPSTVVKSNGETFSVVEVDYRGFWQCHNITSVTMANSVTKIGEAAFAQCDEMVGVTMPGAVNNLPDNVFFECESLSSFTIPPTVQSIGAYAFSGCDALNEITIPDNVKEIKHYAFAECDNLINIVTTAESALETIGDRAFADCKMTTFTITQNVSSLGERVFFDCDELAAVNVADNNEHFSSYNGAVFNKTQTQVLLCPEGCAGTFELPATVTNIGDFAFVDCSLLDYVKIPESLESIGKNAFAQCTGLARIDCHVENPTMIEMGNAVFAEVDKVNCELHVPENSVNAYKSADQWKDFMKIIAGFSGIEDKDMHDLISVYPNPACEILNVNIDNKLFGNDILLMSLDGKLLYCSNAVDAHNGIDVGNLARGIYVVKVGHISQKVVIY